MTKSPNSEPSLVEIYLTAQELQAKKATPPPREDAPIYAERRKSPNIYAVAGMAAAAVMLYFTFQPTQATTSDKSPVQDKGSMVVIGDTSGSKQQDVAPTGDPEKITFTSLLGERLEVGSLFMATVEGSGQIVYTRSDGSSGSAALPGVAHQQNIELTARPRLTPDSTKKYQPESPVTVTPKDAGHLVQIDRSKIAIIFDYAMHGTYTATTDKNSKNTVVDLKAEDNRDVSKISFLPTSSKLLTAAETGLAAPEVNRVNMLTTAADKMATIEAEIMTLKQSINYIESATTNKCYTQSTDKGPADTTSLIKQKVDTALRQALEKWAIENHRILYLDMTGEYPINTASALDQYLAIATGADAKTKEIARDTETIKTSRYSDYFNIAEKKITCVPDDALKSTK